VACRSSGVSVKWLSVKWVSVKWLSVKWVSVKWLSVKCPRPVAIIVIVYQTKNVKNKIKIVFLWMVFVIAM
jgi:hypothetical protein